ncbi:3556_t:CDS:2 [Funneliformis geosporum]|nr:3556_t:CDS:2 [Funneliformis geosporum]
MVDNKLLPKLLQNLLDILDDDEYYDVTIEVGEDPYVKIFRAHIVILYYRSPCLRRILSSNEKKDDGSLTHIKLPNIDPEVFQIILSSKSKEILEIKSEPRITKETQVIEHQVAEETREINLEPQIVKEDWEIKSGIQVTNDTQEILSVSQITQEVNLESQMTKSPMIEFTEKVQATTLDSKIISNQHIELITKLIDHVDTASIYVSSFDLLVILGTLRDLGYPVILGVFSVLWNHSVKYQDQFGGALIFYKKIPLQTEQLADNSTTFCSLSMKETTTSDPDSNKLHRGSEGQIVDHFSIYEALLVH